MFNIFHFVTIYKDLITITYTINGRASNMSVVSSVCSSTSTDSIDLRVSHRMLRSTLRFLKDNIGIVSDVVINKIDKNVDILHKETCSEHLTKKDKDILKKSEKVLQTSVSLFKDSLRQMRAALTEIQEIYEDRIVPTLEQTHEAGNQRKC